MYNAKSPIKKTIKNYLRELENLGIKIKGAILYGSFAKGSPRKDSDIDLLVISNNFKHMNIRKRLEILGIAAVRIMKPIEAYGVTPDEITHTQTASFLREVLNSGISIS